MLGIGGGVRITVMNKIGIVFVFIEFNFRRI